MMKRIFDFFCGLTGLIILSPLFLVAGLLVRFTSSGPVFHRGTRVGRDGELFILYKFRTMVAGAPDSGSGITVQGDKRITPVGRMLRRTKIDELPQLINVLTGEMSLVGPRPEDPKYVALYTPDQRRLLKVRPGITSPASLTYRREEQMLSGADWEKTYCADVLPAKLAMDLAYLARRTFFSDVVLIVRTIFSVLH